TWVTDGPHPAAGAMTDKTETTTRIAVGPSSRTGKAAYTVSLRIAGSLQDLPRCAQAQQPALVHVRFAQHEDGQRNRVRAGLRLSRDVPCPVAKSPDGD